eukprot:TRINITY_DN2472_c2_g1_i2.p1 TRINITY_DN2472_c2_g1~~TRINITY_DN2472_c2_g1_i2.p1  ORF type:complete len:105 (+),score=15.09 TRINITY_DN2472_c2_g1_i2:886-1200(+)
MGRISWHHPLQDVIYLQINRLLKCTPYALHHVILETQKERPHVSESFILQLLGWFVAAPFILGFLFMVFLPCFKLLIQKCSALPSSPKKPFYPNAEVKLKVRDA